MDGQACPAASMHVHLAGGLRRGAQCKPIGCAPGSLVPGAAARWAWDCAGRAIPEWGGFCAKGALRGPGLLVPGGGFTLRLGVGSARASALLGLGLFLLGI